MKNESTVDARGLLCPKPLILTKKKLTETDQPFTVLIDDKTAKSNISRFLKDNGVLFSIEERGNTFIISVNSESYIQPSENKSEQADKTSSAKKTVICIKSSEMGTGPKELGDILLRAFITTIKELVPLPHSVIFYNSGVKLASDDETIIKELTDLESSGVKILVCGTCTNYFETTEKVKVGIISNMFEIMETLTSANKIIYP